MFSNPFQSAKSYMVFSYFHSWGKVHDLQVPSIMNAWSAWRIFIHTSHGIHNFKVRRKRLLFSPFVSNSNSILMWPEGDIRWVSYRDIIQWRFCLAALGNHSTDIAAIWIYSASYINARTKSYYTLKTPGSAWPGKGSIGAKLHSGSKMTRKLVSILQTWQLMGSDWPSSGSISVSSWWFPGHRWPGMEFGPNGPFPGQFLTRVFLECIFKADFKFNHVWVFLFFVKTIFSQGDRYR